MFYHQISSRAFSCVKTNLFVKKVSKPLSIGKNSVSSALLHCSSPFSQNISSSFLHCFIICWSLFCSSRCHLAPSLISLLQALPFPNLHDHLQSKLRPVPCGHFFHSLSFSHLIIRFKIRFSPSPSST